MCESKVILKGKKGTTEVMPEAAKITVEEGKITVYDLRGSKKTLDNCKLKDIDFIKHVTTLESK